MIRNVARKYLKSKWYSLKFFFIKPFYSINVKPKEKLVILPHEGLGDILSLLPALNYLAISNDVIILWNKNTWKQLKLFIDTSEKIECLNFTHNKDYSNQSIDNISVAKNAKLFLLGHYSNFPIYNYPNCFYFQLGVPPEQALKELSFKPASLDFLSLPNVFSYINLRHSNGSETYLDLPESYVISLSDEKILTVRNGIKKQIKLSKRNSLHINLSLAVSANSVICSDAAIYNFLIRIPNHPEILVFTRNHAHFHEPKIYKGIKFDGMVHRIPAKRKEDV